MWKTDGCWIDLTERTRALRMGEKNDKKKEFDFSKYLKNSKLRKLHLSNCFFFNSFFFNQNLNSCVLKKVIIILETNRSALCVMFSRTMQTFLNWIYVCHFSFLLVSSNLSNLFLDGTGAGDETLKKISVLLEADNQLSKLDLGFSVIFFLAFLVFKEWFKIYFTATNSFSALSYKCFAEPLKNNKSLTYLSIGFEFFQSLNI